MFKLLFLFLSGIFIFSGCAPMASKELLYGKKHYSIVKNVNVDVNLRKDLREYFAAGLQGGLNNAYEKGSTYSVISTVKDVPGLDPREIRISFSDQHKHETIKISMEVDSDIVDERRFKSTLNIAIGEIIKNVKQYNNDKEECLCQASGSFSSVPSDSSYTNLPSGGGTLKGLSPIPLPRI